MGFEIFGFAVGMQDSFVFPHGLQLRVLALSEFSHDPYNFEICPG